MNVSHTRSAAPRNWRDRPTRSRSQAPPAAGRPVAVEAPRGSPIGPHAAPGSFDGAHAVQAAGAGSGADAQTGAPDHGVLDELRALHLSLFDSWLSEDQLGHLVDTAYRAPPPAGHADVASVPDEIGRRAADALGKRKA
jgi:hypothetical protein